MADENRCENCKYYRVEPEYWHDHYLIPEHHYCCYGTRYREYEVEPTDCCEYHKRRKEQ